MSSIETKGATPAAGNLLHEPEGGAVAAVLGAVLVSRYSSTVALIVNDDVRHSTVEPQHFALGHTDAGRHLFRVDQALRAQPPLR